MDGATTTRTIRSRIGRVAGFLVVLSLAACGGSGGSGGQASQGQDRSPNDGPETATVPAGTEVVARLDDELSTRSQSEGDEFTARVDSAVVVDGRTAIPSGAVVHGTVTGVQQAGGDNDKGVISLDVAYVEVRGERQEVSARLVGANPEVRSETSTGEAAAKVGGAAAAGAILGRVIGGDGTGAAVGGAVGAAAGTGIVLATKDGYAVLPRGSRLRLELTDALTVPVSGAEVASASGAEEGSR